MRAKFIVVLTFLLLSASSGFAGNQKVLYTFTGGLDGGQPYAAGVIFDAAGNLYGVTQFGGANNQGTVFQLTPTPGGAWTETVLHSFTGGTDGGQPQGGLAIDGEGNLYGTASFGGDPNSGCGTVFELSPAESAWTFAVLHAFARGKTDGCSPQADLSLPGGGIWGTTAGGGSDSQGTFFRLPFSGGDYSVWPFQGTIGLYPGGLGNVAGNVYGTTYYGGEQELGTIFEPEAGYHIAVKHVFNYAGKAGYYPIGNLASQISGGLYRMYGTTSAGGTGRGGTVYQLTDKNYIYDNWALSIVHSFSGPDGYSPWAGVVLDGAGNIYGTTRLGGTDSGYAGTVFKLTPEASNKWAETVLYSFTGGADGSTPTGSLVLDNAENVYGTTNYGGAYNQGVVYEIVNTTAVVKPAALTFGPQRLHTTSPALRISLFNTSPLPITVTSVNLQGDFAVSVDKCQNGVKPDTHCDIYVTFTPTGTGTAPRTGSITFVDTASNSPQSAQLSGTLPGISRTVVITSGSPSLVGQPVTFTATVTSPHGTIPDGEMVTFYDGATTLGPAALAGGIAEYTTSSLLAKTHRIKAIYAGDAAFELSIGSVEQLVDKYPTTTALTSSLNPSAYGQAVTFTATVASAGPTPTGKVTFKDGATAIGTVTLSGGVAKLATSKLVVGTHSITSEYLGDADSATSTSAVLDQVVQ